MVVCRIVFSPENGGGMKRKTGDRMDIWGAGPRLALFTALFCIPIVPIRLYFADWFRMDLVPLSARIVGGILFVILGVVLWITGLVAAVSAFRAGRLCTSGPFAVCRHPAYGAWIVFLLPGLSLLLNCWSGIVVSVIMYFLLRLLVRKEEAYLDRTFGEQFRAYKRRVPLVLPIGWLRRS